MKKKTKKTHKTNKKTKKTNMCLCLAQGRMCSRTRRQNRWRPRRRAGRKRKKQTGMCVCVLHKKEYALTHSDKGDEDQEDHRHSGGPGRRARTRARLAGDEDQGDHRHSGGPGRARTRARGVLERHGTARWQGRKKMLDSIWNRGWALHVSAQGHVRFASYDNHWHPQRTSSL